MCLASSVIQFQFILAVQNSLLCCLKLQTGIFLPYYINVLS